MTLGKTNAYVVLWYKGNYCCYFEIRFNMVYKHVMPRKIDKWWRGGEERRWYGDGEDTRYRSDWTLLPWCALLVDGQSKKTYPEMSWGLRYTKRHFFLWKQLGLPFEVFRKNRRWAADQITSQRIRQINCLLAEYKQYCTILLVDRVYSSSVHHESGIISSDLRTKFSACLLCCPESQHMYVKYLHQGLLTLSIKGFQVKLSPWLTYMHYKQKVREGKQKQYLLQTQVDFVTGIRKHLILWNRPLETRKYISVDISESIFWKGMFLRCSPPRATGHEYRYASKHTNKSFTVWKLKLLGGETLVGIKP